MATTNKGKKGSEILESPEAILDRFKNSEAFFQKNRNIFLYGGLAIVIAVLGFFGYKYFNNQKNDEGQAALAKPVFSWEKDSLKTALKGSKGEDGLTEISESYSGTDAGNLANYYAGVALLKQGDFEGAIEKLKDFSSSDLLLQGQVYSLIGDAYLEQKDNSNAIEYYNKAANYKPNADFTPNYLMKLALACELNKEYDNAIQAYDKIVNEYPKCRQISDAKKYKARAEGLSVSADSKK